MSQNRDDQELLERVGRELEKGGGGGILGDLRARYGRSRSARISLRIFLVLFLLSLLAPLWCNDKPLVASYQGELRFPLLKDRLETEYGGDFETLVDFKDPLIREILSRDGNWAVFPPWPHDAGSVDEFDLEANPQPPSARHILGTDDRGRDVFARVVYGFRNSVLFALTLTFLSTLVGVAVGALQGYFGGLVDLSMQRFIEIWGSMPTLYLLVILLSFFEAGLGLLLGILLLFSWMGLSDYVRAEFLKNRNMDYVRQAKALGLSDRTIMRRHILPNSLTPVLTFLPFSISGAVMSLTSLDFLGLGVPGDQAGLGELLAQGKDNLDAWWIALAAFVTLVIMLLLLVLIGQGARGALDVYGRNVPEKAGGGDGS